MNSNYERTCHWKRGAMWNYAYETHTPRRFGTVTLLLMGLVFSKVTDVSARKSFFRFRFSNSLKLPHTRSPVPWYFENFLYRSSKLIGGLLLPTTPPCFSFSVLQLYSVSILCAPDFGPSTKGQIAAKSCVMQSPAKSSMLEWSAFLFSCSFMHGWHTLHWFSRKSRQQTNTKNHTSWSKTTENGKLKFILKRLDHLSE